MRPPLAAVQQALVVPAWRRHYGPKSAVIHKNLQGLLTFAARSCGILLFVLFALGLAAQPASSQANNVIKVDGGKYPYNAAGVQAALNQVSQMTSSLGPGVVMLPAATIELGSSGLTMPSEVCLVGLSSDSSWLTYSGTGAAISFPPGRMNSGLKDVTVALTSSAGANASAISMRGNYSANAVVGFAKVIDVTVMAPALRPGEIGISLADLSPFQPAPSGVQLSWFEEVKLVNLGQPIVVSGQEGNFWANIHINGFSSLAVNDTFSSDNFWQLRITGPAVSPTAVGFQEGGRMNHIHLVCDFGNSSQTCINDVVGRNMWEVSALTPLGTVANSSFLKEVGARTVGAPNNFQVSSEARTNASPCVEIDNSDGSVGKNYLTLLDGVMSIATTKPASCP
jgi:hypothetical protein